MNKYEKLIKKMKDLGMDPNNLSSEDYYELLKMHVQGEFGKEVFKDFIKENNVSYNSFIEGLEKLSQIHQASSSTYTETLNWLIKDLRKEIDKGVTPEERKEIDRKIADILDRLERETDKNRAHGIKLTRILGGSLLGVVGVGAYFITKNPELLKKGTEMIAKETIKQATKK